MAESVASAFSNASIEHISLHAQARVVESDRALVNLAVKGTPDMPPVRLFDRQHHATKGVREKRLFAWTYIRRQEPDDLVAAVGRARESSGAGKGKGKGKGKGWSPSDARPLNALERQSLLQRLEGTPVYHFVSRGLDPAFHPPQDKAGQEIPTAYFASKIGQFREMMFRRLFDTIYDTEIDDPPLQRFQELMADEGFVECLRAYYEGGDTSRESSLHLMGRFLGGKCFLFQVLKHNLVDLLAYLLQNHTPEVTKAKPWLRLAEPLLPFGAQKMTAFHEAAYLGHPECMRKLCDWAVESRLEGQVREALNLESRRDNLCLTALGVAELMGNMECRNVLAPIFAVELVVDGRDEKPRAVRQSETSRSRIVLKFRNYHGNSLVDDSCNAACVRFLDESAQQSTERAVATHQVSESPTLTLSWRRVIAEIVSCLQQLPLDQSWLSMLDQISQEKHGQDLGQFSVWVEVHWVCFAADGGTVELEESIREWWATLVTRDFALGTDGLASGRLGGLRLQSCRSMSAPRDVHTWLRVLIDPTAGHVCGRCFPELRLILAAQVAEDSGEVDDHCSAVALAAPVVPTEEDLVGLVGRATELAESGAFLDLSLAGMFRTAYKGLGMAEGYSRMPRAKLLALEFSILPYRFARNVAQEVAERATAGEGSVSDDQRFEHSLALLKPVEAVGKEFFSEERLLDSEPRDVRSTMDTHAIEYITTLIRTWFSRWELGSDWHAFVILLLADQPLHSSWRELLKNDNVALDEVVQIVRGAFDKALATFVRMHVILQDAYARWAGTSSVPRSFVDYFEALIPEGARQTLSQTMSKTRGYRRAYYAK